MLNSGYGALANKHFLYYEVENAEAITLTGQLVNKWTGYQVDEFLKEILSLESTTWVYSDTDSAYFSIGSFVDTLNEKKLQDKVDLCERFCDEVISPKIKEVCDDLKEYMNSYEQRMFWEREVIADRASWVGKKKYVMSVLDNEGTRYTSEPKYKIMGMESVKSSTPEWSRDYLKECYKIALTKEESDLHTRLEEIRDEFHGFDVNTIAIPSGINGIDKYYDPNKLFVSGTPKHVKAALVHNKMVDDLGLKRVPKLVDGSKIKYIELKMPNPTGYPVIAFDTFMPVEFDLEKYVDRETIFEKSFMSPLRIFLNAIQWKEEEQIDLLSF